MKSKLPKIVIKEFFLGPDPKISSFVKDAPRGYLVKKVDQKKAKAIVTYELES